MLRGLRGNLYVVLLTAIFFYISVTYNACSEVNFETDAKLTEKMSTQSIVINSGAQYTSDTAVTLTLFSPYAHEMLISNASDCSTGQWEPYSENKSWDLGNNNDSIAVFVKYKINGDESECTYDDIIHDNLPPELTFLNKQDKFSNLNSESVQFAVNDSGSGIETIQCSLNPNANFRPCSTTVALQLLTEGAHSFYVVVSDKAGNKTEPMDYRWTVDMTKPEIVINSQPLKLDNKTNANFEFTATDSISGIEKILCSVDGANFSECSSPFSKNGLSENAHDFVVKAVDKAGNESDPINYNWTIDATAPSVTITKYPAAISKDNQANFEFTGKDGNQNISDFMCKIDAGTFAVCTSPIAYSNLSEGPHTFFVKGKDSAGNDSATASYSWVIDNTPPTIAFVQKPNLVTKDQIASFQIDAKDINGSGIDKIECKLDSNSFANCGSVVNLANLTKGSHTFSARATDKAGNTSATISHTWMIDLDKPMVTITKMPEAYTKESSADFEFKATDVGSGVAGYECRLDGGNYQTCSSPKSYLALADGPHTFYVRAKDNAGNVSDSASYTWKIDNTPPVIQFVKAPKTLFEGEDAVIYFTVSDDGGISSLTCYLDANATGNCAADMDLKFADQAYGNHSFRVLASDNAGNQAAAEISWSVDIKTINHSEEIAIAKNTKTDILFIMDTSGSMSQEMQNMKQRIDSFLDKITELDWQIAVGTTDPTTAYDGDGRLLEIEGGSGKVLYKSDANAKTLLGNTLEMRINGSAQEKGINSLYRAIERYEDKSLAENDSHRLLFRDSAHLAVIVISDEDENSNGQNLTQKSQPEEILKKVKATWPNKNFIFNSIVWDPADSKTECSTGGIKGVKYAELTNLTGGIIGSVCAPDYGEILKNMGEKVVQLQKSLALKCDPVDADKDGKPDITVSYRADASSPYAPYNDSYTLGGSKITYTNFLPEGDFKVEYTCKSN